MAPRHLSVDLDLRSVSETVVSSDLGSPQSNSGQTTSTATTSNSGRSTTPFFRNRQGTQSNAVSPPTASGSEPPPLKKTLGWPRLAELVSKNRGLESFARFRELNVKNLLYYQVELAYLERDLDKCERKDYTQQITQGRDAVTYAKYPMNMIECADESYEDDIDREAQWELVSKMRTLLKEYNDALIQYKQISTLPEPESLCVETLRRWVHGPDSNVMGEGDKTWGGENPLVPEAHSDSLWKRFLFLFYNPVWPRIPEGPRLDLVATAPRPIDGFTKWIGHQFIPFLDLLWHRLKRVGERYYDEEKKPGDRKSCDSFGRTYSGSWIQNIASVVATLLACMLPIAAISVLARAEGMPQILGEIAGFTALFALGLLCFTDCGNARVQIFTATAAFSAVLVVFVQNQ